VVNAFSLRALSLMADMARALGRDTEANTYADMASTARAAFQQKLFDPARGVYRDGEGTDHAALHSNLFPLAFGLVPDGERERVTSFVASRGMACSVYAAQYLMEALFNNDAGLRALELITAPSDRSWRHMVETGTTITYEAWDQRYKPNQDWNHAWGAAPANLFSGYILGARPLAPGWSQAMIHPHPGNLASAEGKIPTPQGPILLGWKNGPVFSLSLTLPAGMQARVALPASASSRGVFTDGKPVPAHRVAARWLLDLPVSGSIHLEVR
jgi:hypothetical protein